MPTPTGLPKPGEIWRRTQTLPKPGSGGREWETETIDVEILERGSGQMWSVQVRLPNGQVKLWTEMSYDFSRGNFTFLRSAKDNAPNESVVPGSVAAVLENLGVAELLAGAPDLSRHQRVRWNGRRLLEVGELIESIDWLLIALQRPSVGMWEARKEPGRWYILYNTDGGGIEREDVPEVLVDILNERNRP